MCSEKMKENAVSAGLGNNVSEFQCGTDCLGHHRSQQNDARMEHEAKSNRCNWRWERLASKYPVRKNQPRTFPKKVCHTS